MKINLKNKKKEKNTNQVKNDRLEMIDLDVIGLEVIGLEMIEIKLTIQKPPRVENDSKQFQTWLACLIKR